MSLVTYFKTTLPCMHCGTVGEAWIASPLGDEGATYQVGDCPGEAFQVDLEDSFLRVREPAAGEPVRALHRWSCSTCNMTNLAVVTLANGCVAAIEPAKLDRATLARVHHIDSMLDEVLATVIGEPIWTDSGPRPDWLPRLRAALDAHERASGSSPVT